MFVVDWLSPRKMLQLSTTACLVSALAVSMKADESAEMLYACALMFGFAVSWQFGAAYSWVSEHLDVVVRSDRHGRVWGSHLTTPSL